MSETTGWKVSYLLMGLGIGSALGVFFAPKSGKDTRKYLVEKAEEGTKYAQRQVHDLRERGEEFVEQGQKVVAHQKELISGAIDAGRDAYHQVMSKVV